MRRDRRFEFRHSQLGKRVGRALTGGRALAAWLVLAATPLLAIETLELRSVFATLGANGRVEYQITAKLTSKEVLSSAGTTVIWHETVSGRAIYDPAQRRAWESLSTETPGKKISSRADCLADPWLIGSVCTNGQVEDGGGQSLTTLLSAPVTASILSAGDREKVKVAFEFAQARKKEEDLAAQRAEAKRKAAQEAEEKKKKEVRNAQHTTTAKADTGVLKYGFPAPTPARSTVKGQVHSSFDNSIPVVPPLPPYGAEYIAGVAAIKANQVVTVPVSIKNLSSQTWPANGLFHLSYHWVQGPAMVVFDGERTVLPAAVAPGGAVALAARLKGPPSPGAYTLKWDLVHEGVTWFSGKGVPTKDQNVTVTP